ncbi:superoxide dismutase [Cu-Zn] SodC [Pokkaliibacter sp. CJK22405]|uniref:superoxide dismutase [Cu-Zn] SodC n=1 Tax=Pokkaliibacter sp. CJK22405 TaxID=3384615 RepID=UPI00398543D3
MKRKLWFLAGVVALASSQSVLAETLDVDMYRVSKDGIGEPVGHVQITETRYGLEFTPDLKGLKPGPHGFHIHAKGNCEVMAEGDKIIPAGAAGGHFDPENTGQHEGPYGEGHLGDLPSLLATDSGEVNYPVLAPRIHKLSEIKGLALMLHAGGDNYSDEPAKLGGGGSRVACGVIGGQ